MNKIDTALDLIKEALPKGKSAIGFSGGTDSLVVLHLVRSIDKSVVAVFSNTGVESPHTVKFCRSQVNLIEMHPIKSFMDCIEDYGWPEVKANAKTHGNQCCNWLKEKPSRDYYNDNDIDVVFTGLTQDESRNRWMLFKRLGALYYAKTHGNWRCHPIWDWSEDDVWSYIRSENIPYNPIYDNGAKRCGCMPCTAYTSYKKQLAIENPKLLKWVLRKRFNQYQLTDFKPCGEWPEPELVEI